MNRLLDNRVARHFDVRPVEEKRGVQSDERIVLKTGVAGEMFLDGARVGAKHLRDGCDPHAFRERAQVRKTRRIPPIHEHESARLQDSEGEGLELLGDDAIGPPQDRGLEWNLEDCGEVRVLPVLVFLGGKTEGLKTPDGGLSDLQSQGGPPSSFAEEVNS